MHNPEAVDSIMEKVLTDMDLLTRTRRYQVLYYWPKIVGDVSTHAKPRRLDGDVLFVATSSATWAQELTMMKRDIIGKLNCTLGGKYIKDIYFSEHLWDSTESSSSEEKERAEREFDDKEYRVFRSKNTPTVKRELAESGVFEVLQSDPRLSLTFQKFTVTMGTRQRYLLQKGYKRCPVCGYIYDPKHTCPHCKNAREYKDHQRILAALQKHPEMSDTSLSKATGITNRLQFEKARRELDSRWHDAVTNGVFKAVSGNLSKEEHGQLANLVENLVMLRTMKPAHELTEEDFKEAVGKRLFQLMKKAGVNINR